MREMYFPSNTNPIQPEADLLDLRLWGNSLETRHGTYFNCVIPEGWLIGEDGQYAFSIYSPDQSAIAAVSGNSNLFPGTSPFAFAQQTLMALQPMNLQVAPLGQIQPLQGFNYAESFDVSYQKAGGGVPDPWKGINIVNVYQYYGGCLMAINMALARTSHWKSAQNWLPEIALLITANNGGAFGIRGAMQQNLHISQIQGKAMEAYRQWSSKLQSQVQQERAAVMEDMQEAVRDNLGAEKPLLNPYTDKVAKVSTQYAYYWVNTMGEVFSTNDPLENPNNNEQGGDYRRMIPVP